MGTGTSAQAVQGFAMAIGAHTQVWGCRHECTGVCVDVCIRAKVWRKVCMGDELCIGMKMGAQNAAVACQTLQLLIPPEQGSGSTVSIPAWLEPRCWFKSPGSGGDMGTPEAPHCRSQPTYPSKCKHTMLDSGAFIELCHLHSTVWGVPASAELAVTAGPCGWTAPGLSVHGSPTPERACTRRHGCHSPGGTGSPCTRGTVSRPTWPQTEQKEHVSGWWHCQRSQQSATSPASLLTRRSRRGRNPRHCHPSPARAARGSRRSAPPSCPGSSPARTAAAGCARAPAPRCTALARLRITVVGDSTGSGHVTALGATHSTGDGAEGAHPVHVVGVAATPRLPARILTTLQHELLSLEAAVLEAHPAAGAKGECLGTPSPMGSPGPSLTPHSRS